MSNGRRTIPRIAGIRRRRAIRGRPMLPYAEETLTVLYHGLKRQAARTPDELRKFQPHLNRLWRIRWAALLTTRLSPIGRSTLKCSAGGQYSTSVATKIEHSRMRVLRTSVFAVVLASGAYAQQQPGAYATQPGASQQQGANQVTCSGLKASCERNAASRGPRRSTGVDCESTFRSCLSTGTWVTFFRRFDNVQRR